MSRLHVHLHVRDLEQSIRFYTALFAVPPTRVEPGYAKWLLEDPRVNFALSTGGAHEGVGHLGIQVESEAELAERSARARDAAGSILVERGAQCCYATGNKAWTEDPQGVKWETFHTTGTLAFAGEGADETFIERGSGTAIADASCQCRGSDAKAEAPKATAACCT